mgnify:CR=1 FL=1
MTTESAPVPEQSLTWRILAALPPVLLLAGIAFLVYPVVATQHNNAEQQRAAAAYGAEVSAQAPDVLAQELASADAYNQEGAEARSWTRGSTPSAPTPTSTSATCANSTWIP